MPSLTKALLFSTVCLLCGVSAARENMRGDARPSPKEAVPLAARESLRQKIREVAKTKPVRAKDTSGLAGKLDVKLLDAWKTASRTDVRTAIAGLQKQRVQLAPNGQDVVAVALLEDGANPEEVERSFKACGAGVIRSGDGAVKVTIPVGQLDKLALAGGVRNVRPILPPRERNTVTTEGVSVSLANAWHSAGLTAQGVKVAVVDVGFANLATLKAQDEIPASAVEVNYSSTTMTGGSSVHGSACAEILYDMAPGALLYLIKIDDATDMVSAKNYCIANGITLVSCSLGWDCLNFHDGMSYANWYTTAANHPVKAVEAAATAGILWVNAGGNEQCQHTLIDWRDADSDTMLDWDATSYNVNPLYLNGSYTIPANTLIDILMTWNRWPTTNQDFDLYLVKWDGSDWTIVYNSQNVQQGDSQSYPYEEIYYTTTAQAEYSVVVVKFSASTAPKFILRYYCDNADGGDSQPYFYGYDNSTTPVPGSVVIPGDSASAFTVGSLDFLKYTTGPIDYFSSLGPNNRAYTGGTAVMKPDICGPDYVTGVSYGAENFAGTSAATPHVAGLAALVKGVIPEYTPAQIRAVLESYAYDLGGTGKDNTYGAGAGQLPAPAVIVPLRVTVDQAEGQRDPTNAAPVNFTVLFSEPVADFATGDVTVSGTAPGTKTATVTGSGTNYNVAVTGMTGSGTVIASVAAGKATGFAGKSNWASTSTDNTVIYDVVPPSVTVNQAKGQYDPTNTAPVNFTVLFSEPVSGFAAADVTISGTAPGSKTVTVTGGGTNFNVAVTGMTGSGTVIASVASGGAADAAGNGNAASTGTDNTVIYDVTAPAVTVSQAAGQPDPTNAAPVNFTVLFSEPVSGFASADVTVSGTAPGTKTATVTGSGATYNVAVTGMTGGGTVAVSVAAGLTKDAAGNVNTASTAVDNTVEYDVTAPTVTVNQAAGQPDPANTAPVNFTVLFSEPVTGFATGDVTLTGTAPGTKTATVTGSGTTYNVAVTGMTGSGTLIASVAAGKAKDAAGNGNAVSTSTDNTVTCDVTPPTVTINQAAGQRDPTNTVPVNFKVVFSEAVTGFGPEDVVLSGTAPGPMAATVTGSNTTYNVAVAGMTGGGTVVAAIAAGGAWDTAGTGNIASTSTDNTVTYDVTAPAVSISQAAGQRDPTNAVPVNFRVLFSEAVTGFAAADVAVTGTAPGVKTVTVTGSGTNYLVAVRGMTGGGTVAISIAGGLAKDAAGNGNTASTSEDDTVTYDPVAPTVTIIQAAGQRDPTNAAPLNFTVVFSEPVTGFETGDVTLTGTAPGTKTATVTGSGTNYSVAVTGMTGGGTVIAAIAAGKARDAAGNGNTASTSADNTVTYDVLAPSVTISQATGQRDPTNTVPVNFKVVFGEAVTGFGPEDVVLSGTAPGPMAATVTGSNTTYNVAVAGMTGGGTVVAAVAAGGAADLAGNGNAASTSTDNAVTYDPVAPSVLISQALGQRDPTNALPVKFSVLFSEPVTGFAAADVAVSGTAPGTKTVTVTGSGTNYSVAVGGATGSGTVTISVAGGLAKDAAGNVNAASVSADSTVTYDVAAPSVTVNQAARQSDPTSGPAVNFTVVFSEPVAGFTTGDVTISGTATGTKTATVTGDGTNFNVAVTGMTGGGTVIAAVAASKAKDLAGNSNTASTSTDNNVTYNRGTSRGTPTAWLDQYGLVSGGDYEAADVADSDSDGLSAWQEYVAGTVPTNVASIFFATFLYAEGQTRVHWSPDLTGAVPARVYSIYGVPVLPGVFPAEPLTNLPAGTPVLLQALSTNRFFKVGVGMQ